MTSSADAIRLRTATAADHDAVVAAIGGWWGDRDLTGLMQPLFLQHFASTSLIAQTDDGDLVGLLIGFPSADDPTVGYVHFIGVTPDGRGAGLGRRLHDEFARRMAARGVTTVRCVTAHVNTRSQAFHSSIGFEVEYLDDTYVHLVRRSPPGRFAVLVDARPDDPAWGDVTWPVPEGTVLRGSTVTLTPTVADDAGELFAALDDDRVWAHVRGRPSASSDMRAVIEAAPGAGRFPWTVRLAGEVVGTTSYLEVSPIDARLEIGFTVYSPDVWATRVNPECKLLLMGWAFDHGFGRVQLKTDVRNARSQQAIARLGARFEGLLRRYQRRADGSVRDTVLFSVTAEEWPAVRAALEARLAP